MDHYSDKALQSLTRGGDRPGGGVARRPSWGTGRGMDQRTQNLSALVLEVAEMVGSALKIPVAFADGFLRSFLSIESVEEDDSGRVVIRPRAGVDEEDIFREVDELAARLEPTAIYNPVVRERLDSVVEATPALMRQDLSALADLSPADRRARLAELEIEQDSEELAEEIRSANAEVRARMDEVRRALRRYQAGYAAANLRDDASGTSSGL